MNKFNSTLFIMGALALACSVPLKAANTSEVDTNSLLPATTNTLFLQGDVSGSYTNGQTPGGYTFLSANDGQIAFLQAGAFATNTTANTSNLTFRVAGSIDLANWTNNIAVITLTVPATSTGWCAAITPVSSSYPFYGLRTVENANASVIGCRSNSTYLKCVTKKGI